MDHDSYLPLGVAPNDQCPVLSTLTMIYTTCTASVLTIEMGINTDL